MLEKAFIVCAVKDTHRESTHSNKTEVLRKNMIMNIWNLLNRMPRVAACQLGLRANALACHRGLRANVLACQRGLLARYLRANVPKVCQILIFTCQRPINVPTCHQACRRTKRRTNFSNIPHTKC